MTSGDDTDLPGGFTVGLETEGGFGAFPGLGRPIEVRSEDLDPQAVRLLRNLVREAVASAGCGDTPACGGAAGGGASGRRDARTYTVTVTDGSGLRARLTATDPIPDGPLRTLIRHLQEHGRGRG